ncbi:MAG: DNA polymerase III subunit delta, partial [Planctomycetota bacterium]
FMGLEGRRTVVVEQGDAFLRSNWELVADYLRAPSRTGTLIICLSGLDARRPPGKAAGGREEDKERRAAWRALVEDIRQKGFVVDCAAFSWREAKTWARARAEQEGKRLTPRAVDALLEAVGPNLMALDAELEKLAAYAGAEAAIAERDVATLVPQARSRSVFEMAEAVGRADAAQALALCGRLLLAGESRESMVSVLALQLRRLWQAKRLHESGASEAEIARTMAVPRFVVRRALSVLPRLSAERLARQFEMLAAADVESKTTSLRAQEERVWLENLVARLCNCPPVPGREGHA